MNETHYNSSHNYEKKGDSSENDDEEFDFTTSDIEDLDSDTDVKVLECKNHSLFSAKGFEKHSDIDGTYDEGDVLDDEEDCKLDTVENAYKLLNSVHEDEFIVDFLGQSNDLVGFS